ncbi:hypothetical protein BpHYR1_026616 [Brachionus plicatilis]|uniref:Uncharacterized protein n=1 Tax=Brachionus plicatilis TaxID=10195 RepID=A0A3M7T9M6_BRAPC|nr:hypothetical protein BpHYR1_026616 [Brachionus plicatilis]
MLIVTWCMNEIDDFFKLCWFSIAFDNFPLFFKTQIQDIAIKLTISSHFRFYWNVKIDFNFSFFFPKDHSILRVIDSNLLFFVILHTYHPILQNQVED